MYGPSSQCNFNSCWIIFPPPLATHASDVTYNLYKMLPYFWSGNFFATHINFCSPLQHKPILGRFPGFVLNVVLSGTSVQFEPTLSGFEIVVLNGFDKILEAVSSVPRVETKLYPDESGHSAKPNLKPVIAESVIEEAKEKVSIIAYSCNNVC